MSYYGEGVNAALGAETSQLPNSLYPIHCLIHIITWRAIPGEVCATKTYQANKDPQTCSVQN